MTNLAQHWLGSGLVLLAILFLPYWIYIPILYLAIILLPFFWEGILFAFLIDILYGSGVKISFSLFPPSALVVLFLIIILLPLRRRVRTFI